MSMMMSLKLKLVPSHPFLLTGSTPLWTNIFYWSPLPWLQRGRGRGSSSSSIRRMSRSTPLEHNPVMISLAQQFYLDECAKAFDELINLEYKASDIYLSMYAKFITLPGLAKFFQKSSQRERDHASKLMGYKTRATHTVGVEFLPHQMRFSRFNHLDGGVSDALIAMELALAMEEWGYEKLVMLRTVAQHCNNPDVENFINSEVLAEQKIQIIKKLSEYVDHLRVVDGKDGNYIQI